MKAILTAILLLPIVMQIDQSRAAPKYSLKQQWSAAALSQPLDLQFSRVGKREYAFIVQQSGQILRVRKNSSGEGSRIVLNIADRIVVSGEQGLLGLAIHPRFARNGFIFVRYTRVSDGANVISRFTVDLPTLTSDPASEKVFLVVSQPFSNHNAGALTFGADGLLYIPFGDGGGAGDPLGNAQSLSSLLGKVLRIDVDRPGTAAPYSIPPSNPFVARRASGVYPEIFALGFRNPFKITRDMAGNRLWLGDVGQGMREEIDILKRGANYGWSRMEGDLCFPEGTPCDIPEFQGPVWSIPRSDGRSVTGGYVYRGKSLKRLAGNYIYGDFVTGNIWRLIRQGRTYTSELMIASDRNISSFGQDLSGEVYVVDYAGAIFRLSKR